MIDVSEERLGELLSRLEDLELPLLAWGVVDGFLSEADVTRAIDDQRISEFAAGGIEVPTVEEYLDILGRRGCFSACPLARFGFAVDSQRRSDSYVCCARCGRRRTPMPTAGGGPTRRLWPTTDCASRHVGIRDGK